MLIIIPVFLALLNFGLKSVFLLLSAILGIQKSEHSAKVMLNEHTRHSNHHFYVESMVFIQLVYIFKIFSKNNFSVI